MDPQALLQKMADGDGVTLVDVRTGIEWRRGHVPGALHAPTWKIALRLAALPADRDAELVVTCELGPRARIAKSLLCLLGYRSVVLLDGQMAGWRRLGLPLER